MTTPHLSKKICMLGDFAVGKTSLVRRHVLGVFSSEYHATLGVNVYKHSQTIETAGGETIRLDEILWDIEGHEDRPPLLRTYLHGASGAVIVGDVGRDDVAAAMARHGRFFHEVRPGRPLVFALNKCDLEEARVTRSDCADLEHTFGAPVLETSALSGAAVEDLFRALGRAIVQRGM